MITEVNKLKNLIVKIDDTPVGGCVGFNTEKHIEVTGVYQYLSGEPYAVTSEKTEYTVTLTLIGNYNDYSNKEFSLSLSQFGNCIKYKRCQVLADREYSQKGVIYRELTIGAGERSIENE